MSSLDLWYRILYLHNVIIYYKIYTCCKMLFESQGIAVYTFGKCLEDIISQYWHVGCL